MRFCRDHYLDRAGQEIPVRLTVEYTGGSPQTWMHPAEPATLEIIAAEDQQGRDMNLTDAETDALKPLAWEWLTEELEAELADYDQEAEDRARDGD